MSHLVGGMIGSAYFLVMYPNLRESTSVLLMISVALTLGPIASVAALFDMILRFKKWIS